MAPQQDTFHPTYTIDVSSQKVLLRWQSEHDVWETWINFIDLPLYRKFYLTKDTCNVFAPWARLTRYHREAIQALAVAWDEVEERDLVDPTKGPQASALLARQEAYP